MKKLIRLLAATAVPAVVATGVLLGTGGSAMAATAQPASSGPAPAALTAGHQPCRHIDPWVAGQLAQFDPAAAHRIAVYDPWVMDQLALFTNQGC